MPSRGSTAVLLGFGQACGSGKVMLLDLYNRFSSFAYCQWNLLLSLIYIECQLSPSLARYAVLHAQKSLQRTYLIVLLTVLGCHPILGLQGS